MHMEKVKGKFREVKTYTYTVELRNLLRVFKSLKNKAAEES